MTNQEEFTEEILLVAQDDSLLIFNIKHNKREQENKSTT